MRRKTERRNHRRGRIGKVHAETLAFRAARSAVPAAIADINLARRAPRCRQALRNPRGGCNRGRNSAGPRYRCGADLLSHRHARRSGRAAAQAGKHIFCEKPIEHSLAKIDRALAAVGKAGVKFQVGFNRRFDANFARVRTGGGQRRDRHAAPDAHHQPRSGAAADFVH